MKLKKLKAKEAIDSKGRLTIEVTVNGKFSASCPSGTSTGKNEVKAFPNGGAPVAANFLNKHKEFEGLNFEVFEDLKQVETITEQAGGNTVVALQIALLRAMSKNKIWEFLNPGATKIPIPLGNCIGGGLHTKFSATDFQEFLLMPHARILDDAIFANNYVYNYVGKKLGIKIKTDEGAWAPNLDAGSALQILKEATDHAYEDIGVKVDLGMDIAASSLWNNHMYTYKFFSKSTKARKLTRNEHMMFIADLVKEFDIRYLEDPLEEEDFEGHRNFLVFNRLLTCGDDLVCTNPERLRKAKGKINAVIIKPNQIGSLVKAKEVVDYAKNNDMTPVISHRSGETMDSWISDLAVGWQIPLIKCGIFGKERVAKLKTLKKIQSEIR